MNDHSTPRLKPHLEFYSNEDKVYFFKNPGTAIEMDDPSGFIASVCRLMNGHLDLPQLTQKLSLTHPYESTYLKDLLSVLDESYLLEDCSINQPDNLTDYDISRWKRNIEFFGAYSKANENKFALQKKLQSVKVTLLGLGGAGSHLLYDLAALGVHHIQAVDFDKVELSNLNRQILYNETDIGNFKINVAKNRMSQFAPNANIQFINKKISCSDDIEQLVQGQDIVISVVDQPRESIIDWVNAACIKQKVPFICGAFDWKWALCYSVMPGKTGCIECWKTNAKKSNLLFYELIQKKDFVAASSPNVAIVPFVAILTGLILIDFLKLVTGIAKPQSFGKLWAFDFDTANMSAIESWEKNPQCQICRNAQ